MRQSFSPPVKMLSEYPVRVIDNVKIASNIYNLIIEKPAGYFFIPGQHTEISVTPGNHEIYKRHLSFTGLPETGFLEFILKPCDTCAASLNKFISLKSNDKVLINEARGEIQYKGMGTFIAGGTGITPFISIFKNLKDKNNLAGNSLIYSAGTMDDLIFHVELSEMFGTNYTNLFTRQRYKNYYFGRIDRNFIRMSVVDFARFFYISGSFEFISNINTILKHFGVPEDSIISERIPPQYQLPLHKL